MDHSVRVRSTGVAPPVPEQRCQVEIVGELDLDTQQQWEDAVLAALSRHGASGPVVLDLSRTEFLAISALRSLAVCDAVASAQGRGLQLVGVPRQAERLLRLAGLERLLAAPDAAAPRAS